MNELKISLKSRVDDIVTPDKSALKLASGGVDVYATPMMILLMENTCDFSVRPYLEDGMTTVGIKVNITHTSATPIGMKVWCESELIEIDGRRLVFAVKTFDEKGLIGEGLHERFIVNALKHYNKTLEKNNI